jgi:enoyl-CoA hydratase/carnithine racemase
MTAETKIVRTLRAGLVVRGRLGQARFISVGSIRGRARGIGNEFLTALDVRFASRENAVLGQLEIGSGIIPGCGGIERLWRLTVERFARRVASFDRRRS